MRDIYVAYVDAPNINTVAENQSTDSRGLRIGSATYDSGSLSNWSGSGSQYLISDEYVPVLRNSDQRRFDLVDLALMPEHFIESLPFSGIGCAYISGNELKLAESFSVNGIPEWQYHSVEPSGELIDYGDIIWVKNTYVSRGPEYPSVPYVLYAIRLSEHNWSLRLWRPGGF
ncbi:MAG: hypothetical protein R3F46_14505 [bacterium]